MHRRHVMKGEAKKVGIRGSRLDSGRDSKRGTDVIWHAVGRRLAERRTEAGYSAVRIAGCVGIAASDYSAYENGAPIPAFLLGELAELLGRTVTWFFEGVSDAAELAGEAGADREAVTFQVATVEHRIQALADSFRKLDFEGQQHLLAISRALTRASAE